MKNTRVLTLMAVLVAIGTIGSQLLWFPAGVARAYPVQHAVNVMSAVLLGPGPAVGVALMIGLLRNLLGLGTLLAFPGGMVGAFFAGVLYQKWRHHRLAVTGEILGTGIIGSFLAVPFANFLMGSSVGALAFLPAFIISSVSGASIGWFILSRVHKVKPELSHTQRRDYS
ncbi:MULTISPECIES: energy coupling factor transporter S component ThiW [Oceanobacillus]|uniref:energy coupling factor transporter S component ThiW n=1 Tax=Oceanobacillus TaxID=182709 RepID=UPI000A07CBB5|nr:MULTISPECIES: energy coupling factor transporter S component ThiW [Oceanobacillus]